LLAAPYSSDITNKCLQFFHQNQRGIVVELLSFLNVFPNRRIAFLASLLFNQFKIDSLSCSRCGKTTPEAMAAQVRYEIELTGITQRLE